MVFRRLALRPSQPHVRQPQAIPVKIVCMSKRTSVSDAKKVKRLPHFGKKYTDGEDRTPDLRRIARKM
jgi:hypothetical protein